MVKKISKVGIVAMGNISVGGGYPRVIYDLIKVLNEIGKEVYLLTPFKLDYKKIEQLYGPIKLKKVYYPSKIKSFFCREDVLRRKFMKREFKKMAGEVDFIFDICGRIMDKYLPKDFARKNYVVWGIASYHKSESLNFNNFRRNLKEGIKNYFKSKKFYPEKDIKIYALDQWTRNQLIEKCNLKPEEMCLYPAIQVKELKYDKKRKKNQITINGRIDPLKRIEDGIELFAIGTKNNPEYNLVIIGGTSPESREYIRNLNKLISKLKISKRVEIITNPSFEKIKEELLNSKILIDTQRESNLTMTTIEAMAAGNLVLSYKKGNNYKEILGSGKFGHGFDTIEEGGSVLKRVLREYTCKNNQGIIKGSIKRAESFSRENFVKRIKSILASE